LNEGLYEFREKCEIERMISDSMSNYLKKGECYVDVINEGNGDSVLNGCTVSLSYKAYFSDGRKFDDTDDWKDSIDIVYGQPLQLIVGLESGIHGLREGSEAKIIIPSHLAFGKHGSSSGIVPPYEPLLYNVKIISVKQPSL
jgi:FKBP-type peptidyl-prolyl cis-trans isomerase